MSDRSRGWLWSVLAIAGCAEDAPPSPRLRVSDDLGVLTEQLRRAGSVDPGIDIDALRDEARRRLFASSMDDTQATYAAASYFVDGLKKGHGGVFNYNRLLGVAASCPSDLPKLSSKNGFGVCLAPLGEELVVTFAAADNALSLRAGEIVTRVGGGASLDELASIPYCGSVYPSDAGRRQVAAWAALGLLPAGTELAIRALDGGARTVTLPAPSSILTDCSDVFARPRTASPAMTVRPDGIRVVRVGGFLWNDDEEAMRSDVTSVAIEAGEAELVIWDLRGNSGGLTEPAETVARFLPGAARVAAEPYLACSYRGTDWSPASPAAAPSHGIPRRAAVLVDGACYSACSHLVRMARAAGALLVGTEDNATYSTSYESFGLGDVNVVIDMALCRDARTGEVAEGRPTAMDVAVTYDPTDLAAGRDTVLEAAALALLDGK